jgi:hypothetical protein
LEVLFWPWGAGHSPQIIEPNFTWIVQKADPKKRQLWRVMTNAQLANLTVEDVSRGLAIASL